MLAEDLLPLLRAFALKTRSPNVDLLQFFASLTKGEAQPAEIEAAVKELPADSAIVISQEGDKPRILTLPGLLRHCPRRRVPAACRRACPAVPAGGNCPREDPLLGDHGRGREGPARRPHGDERTRA